MAATLAAVVLLACASSPDPSATDAAIVVTGRVTVTGADPNVMLVIVTETEEYELVGDRAEELWRLQQRTVRVHGRVVDFHTVADDKGT